LNATLGQGDGATTRFVLIRAFGGFVETVQALIGAPTIHIDGAAVPASAYAVSILPATIAFITPPAPGAILTADFTAAHLARFSDDQADLEQFMADFWQSKSLKLETVRA
jgi:uncharacterized protein (TIGR02217 family)